MFFLGIDKDEDSSVTPYYDRIYGTTVRLQETMFVGRTRGKRKNIPPEILPDVSGDTNPRACHPKRVISTINPNEQLWCYKIDVQLATERLPKRDRYILALRYLLGYKEEEIADVIGVSQPRVHFLLDRSLNTIAAKLDRGLDARY